MNPVLAVGNGESRINIDLSTLINKYTLVGCNALCREYHLEHLVCVDRRMVREGIFNYAETIYTRNDWAHEFENTNVQPVPDLPYVGNLREDDPFQWGSGPYAVLVAAHLAETEVHMIGFDLYSTDRKVNNVYKGTSNYVKADSHDVDPRYWIHQIGKVIESFPQIKFKIYNIDGWVIPEKWKKSNVEVLTYKYLLV